MNNNMEKNLWILMNNNLEKSYEILRLTIWKTHLMKYYEKQFGKNLKKSYE